MPLFKVSVGFRRPGRTWQKDAWRDVTTTVTARNGVEAAIDVLSQLEFDEHAEQVHFIHVGEPEPHDAALS